jgi:tetratricopeptide (TPR) repeat protein
MATTTKTLRVFIASPGGLQKERRTFRDILEEFNRSDAVPRGLHFIPVGWEDTLETEGRPQELINSDLEKCDYCVFVLWDRWGSTPGRAKGQFTSGTEEEFHVAERSLINRDLALKQILILFKGVSAAQLADPGQQLRRVLKFRRKIEVEKNHIYHHFDEIVEFERLLRRFLSKWTRDQELSEQGKPITSAEDRILDSGCKPSKVNQELQLAKAVIRFHDPESVARYGLYLAGIERWSRARIAIAVLKRLLDAQPTHNTSIDEALRSILQELSKDETDRHGRIVFGGRTVHIDKYLIALGRVPSGKHYFPGITHDIRLELADEYGTLGRTLAEAGFLELALELQHRRLAIVRSQDGVHENEQAGLREKAVECLTDLAITNCLASNCQTAERFAREAMTREASSRLGNESFIRRPQSPTVAITNHNLGIILADVGDYETARELLESARSFWAEAYGDGVGLQRPRPVSEEISGFFLVAESDSVSKEDVIRGDNLWAASHAGIGLVYLHEEEFGLAEKFHFEAQLRVGYLGEAAPAIANNLGAIHYLTGRLESAVECFRQSLTAQRGGLAKIARTLRNLVVASGGRIPADVLSSNELAELLNRYSILRSTNVDIYSL